MECSRSIPAGDESGTTALTRPSDLNSPTAFTEVLNQVQLEPQNKYTSTNMPPSFPSTKPQHILKVQKGAIPKGKDHYLPMYVPRATHSSVTTLRRGSRHRWRCVFRLRPASIGHVHVGGTTKRVACCSG